MEPRTTIYPARRILTMDPENPSAAAVAVREGRILAVGEPDELAFWIRNSPFSPHQVDSRFQDMVLMPGLVDAHTHLELQALIYSGHFLAQVPWPRPEGGFYPVCPKKGDVLHRLKELDRRLPPGEVLFGVAYDENRTGAFLHAGDLDAVSAERPILVSNLVFHRFGKRADFCVLGEDPLETPPAALNAMPVWGTVFAGEPNPA